MDRVLRSHWKYAAAYINDIVIHGSEWETHLNQVSAVVQALRKAGLTANPKKCQLGLREAEDLGYTIGKECVKPQVKKVEAIQDWPRPLTKKQVRTFVGLTSYYRRFIPHFASLASLTYLTRSRLPAQVKWTEETEKAFQNLKGALCSEPVLVTPDFSKPLVVQTDASETGGCHPITAPRRSGAAHGNADALSRRDALGSWTAPPSRSELRGEGCVADSRDR
ncbi:uncharacterized protein ACWYII_036893 [Salvelinus alpinus]|uniref:uncharacterized protein isoform X1 n=1 Tax=Salvelinus sp. IW2-2015 TaxID=2691554 RepID=UPI0038D4E5B4